MRRKRCETSWCWLQSTYTGVHAHGGPTTVDPSKDLSALLDRSESDVRGVKRGDSTGSVRSSLATPPTMPSPGVQASLQSEPSAWIGSRQSGIYLLQLVSVQQRSHLLSATPDAEHTFKILLHMRGTGQTSLTVSL